MHTRRFNKKMFSNNKPSFFCEPFFTRLKNFSNFGTLTRTSNDLSYSVFTFFSIPFLAALLNFRKRRTRANLMRKLFVFECTHENIVLLLKIFRRFSFFCYLIIFSLKYSNIFKNFSITYA